METFETKMFLLALLVVTCFVLVGIALGIGSVWLSLLFLFAGFFFMGVGLRIKRKQRKDQS